MFYLLLGKEMQQQTKIYTLKSGQNFVKKKQCFKDDIEFVQWPFEKENSSQH